MQSPARCLQLWWAHHTGLCQAKQQVGHITPTPHTCAEKYQCMICTPAVCTSWCYIEAGIRVVMNSCTEGQQILVTERVVETTRLVSLSWSMERFL